MNRRFFLAIVIAFIPSIAFAANRKFVFKIKTKSGGITGNIVIHAKDAEEAKYLLQKRYPGCTIMSMEEKK